jgi:hypothetical protein
VRWGLVRIKIEAEGYRFTIPLPIGIFINGPALRIMEKCVKKHAHVPLSAEQVSALLRALKQAKKTFPNLTLVDVKSADGQRVVITL